jgi:ATPase subunit of ABC transporter with duplicated ATPase domains
MLSLSSVSFSYTSVRTVLSDVDLELGAGWHGLVGDNGSGKTTLLSLMSGDLQPDTGRVATGGLVVRCSQVVDRPGPGVRQFARSDDPADYALRGRLALHPEMVERWPSLSPGERRRWQVAAALASQPDVLLLDEPTNHLDTASSSLLLGALERFPGCGVLVSPDRAVLDRLTVSTVRVIEGEVEHWQAPYSTARVEWERAAARHEAARETAARAARSTRRRLADEQREAHTKIAAWKRSQRYARPGDHDTTSASRTKKFRDGQAAAGRRIAAVREQAVRAQAELATHSVRRNHGGPIAFDGTAAPRQVLVRFEGDLTVADHRLATGLDVVVDRSTRLRIDGPNGSGKTTLLELLVRDWDLPTERMAVLPQDMTDEDARHALGTVLDRPADDLGRVMQLFARLGGDPTALMASRQPSPGELRKLMVADALERQVWCLFLDEPTNHFDLDTVERLEEGLRNYPGALVVVSHDERFAAAVTDATLALSPVGARGGTRRSPRTSGR